MKYKVLKQFKARTPEGEIDLQVGQIITLPEEKAIKLLRNGKISPVDKVAYKVYSEILGCYLWIVETDHDLHSLRAQGISEAIYALEEIKQLRKISDKEELKAIHRVKETFENSKIEQIITREDSND